MEMGSQCSQQNEYFNIATFNCKNLETSKLAIQNLAKDIDILLLQEHWYYDCQLNKLSMVSDEMVGAGKAVDSSDPILPVQMPRGYGGTAILWQKTIDHLITPVPDGGNRIQCAELHGQQPALLISVYMPCRGLRDNIDDFEDCVTQLQEVITKYSDSHSIILGGDFNEDLTVTANTRRKASLERLLSDNNLSTLPTGKTYMGPGGAEVSTIDYIFYSQSLKDNVVQIQTLIEDTSVSDHYPVKCILNNIVDRNVIVKPIVSIKPPRRVRWDKIDMEGYRTTVEARVSQLRQNIPSAYVLDQQIIKVQEIMVQASSAQGPRKLRRQRKAKLIHWTPAIQQAVKDKKKAFHEWKKGNRPSHSSNTLTMNKKLTTSHLRKLCRVESAKAREESRQAILDARTSNTKLFHQLINKQRGKMKYCVNELNVGGGGL